LLGSNFVITKINSAKKSALFFSQLPAQSNGVSRAKSNARNFKSVSQLEPSKPATKSNCRNHRREKYSGKISGSLAA
jgi:hypothetical protein